MGGHVERGVAVGSEHVAAGSSHLLGVILAAATTAVLILLLLIVSGLASPRERIPFAVRAAAEYVEPAAVLGYRYEGVKARLREVYMRMLRLVEGGGLRLPRGYTPLEVAREALRAGLYGAARVARLYRDYAYAPRQPPERIVREAEEALSLEAQRSSGR